MRIGLKLLLLAGLAGPVWAEPPKEILSVTRWRMDFTVTAASSGAKTDEMGKHKWNFNAVTTGTAILDTIVEDERVKLVGRADIQVTGGYNGRSDMPPPAAMFLEASGNFEDGVPSKDSAKDKTVVYLQDDGFQVDFGSGIINFTETVTGNWMKPQAETHTWLAWYQWNAHWSNHFPYPASGTTMTGTATRTYNYTPAKTPPGTQVPYELVVTLTPVMSEDVELVVEADSPKADGGKALYNDWRPTANADDSPGEPIEFLAKLRDRNGGNKPIRAERFEWRLSGVSSEPGIAMNFPLDAFVEELDLKFQPLADQRITEDGAGQDHQTMVHEKAKSSSDRARVASFDWGAWGELSVVAVLADGKRITGKFTHNGKNTLPLPKRENGSYIAESWKRDHGVSGTADKDDDETEPNGLKGADGDGFTLYEEYRGFYVGGKHVEGDPKRKDFFLRNFVGTDAYPGIRLFEEVSGLVVHDGLRDDEYDPDNRVMNANRSKGPHRVDQHGVQLQTVNGLDGGLTVMSKANVRGRPKYVLSCGVQPRGDQTPTTTTDAIRISDQVFMYDRAVAHELFHAVGVEHHGTGDGEALFTFRFADDPKNTTGKPQYVMGSRYTGTPVRIIDEASGRDLAAMREGVLNLVRETIRPLMYPDLLQRARVEVAGRANYPGFHMTAEEWAENEFLDALSGVLGPMDVFVGSQHGECSGDEDCLMRYSFARMYEAVGQKDTYYWITNPGSERAGMELCTSSVGTGVNAPERKPQPRYGDAAAGRGACRGWLCVNDAIEPDSDAIPEETTKR